MDWRDDVWPCRMGRGEHRGKEGCGRVGYVAVRQCLVVLGMM